jgi:hypothetical protein
MEVSRFHVTLTEPEDVERYKMEQYAKKYNL